VGVLVKDGVAGKRIEARSLDLAVSVGRQMVGTKSVDGDEDDWRAGRNSLRRAAAPHGEQGSDGQGRPGPVRAANSSLATKRNHLLILCSLSVNTDADGRIIYRPYRRSIMRARFAAAAVIFAASVVFGQVKESVTVSVVEVPVTVVDRGGN